MKGERNVGDSVAEQIRCSYQGKDLQDDRETSQKVETLEKYMD